MLFRSDAGEFAELVVANSNELVIETKGTDEDGEYYNKMTYKRM